MTDKNRMALFITYSVALTIAWFLWGSIHNWVTWLFIILLMIGILAHGAMLLNRLQSDTFDGILAFNAAGTLFFGLFLMQEASNTNIAVIQTIGYLIGGILGLLLLFTMVRYFQYCSSH